MTTAVDSRADTLRTLEQHGLLTPGQLASARTSGGRDVLASLVEAGHLTRFQADAVKAGNAEQLSLAGFTLVDILGDGGMGKVFKARLAKDGNYYAIRTVARKNVVNLKAVVDKVESLKQVRHPRVSAMVAVGAMGDRVYMAWPLLEGGSKLDDIVSKQGRLAAKQAAQVAMQVASGLQAYHTHGLFHGLLKANDILIGGDRRVRILDFGVGFLLTCERGKSMLSTMTNGKALAKGLDCASPEAIVDPLQRTMFGDQYSLGCILYFCLTGQYPFPDKNPVKKMLGHQFEVPTPVRQLAPETPAKLEAIVHRLLAKTPEERYPTTDDLVAQLQLIASDARVAAAPPSVTPVPKKAISPSAIAGQKKQEPTADPDKPAAPAKGRMPWSVLVAGLLAGVAGGALAWFLKG